jgi:hypothetical protein
MIDCGCPESWPGNRTQQLRTYEPVQAGAQGLIRYHLYDCLASGHLHPVRRV